MIAELNTTRGYARKCPHSSFAVASVDAGLHTFCLLDLQGAVEARNRDYANIVRSLNFVSKGWYDTQVLADDDDIRRKVNDLAFTYVLPQFAEQQHCQLGHHRCPFF